MTTVDISQLKAAQAEAAKRAEVARAEAQQAAGAVQRARQQAGQEAYERESRTLARLEALAVTAYDRGRDLAEQAADLEREADQGDIEAMLANKEPDDGLRKRAEALRWQAQTWRLRGSVLDRAIAGQKSRAEHARAEASADFDAAPELCRTCVNLRRCAGTAWTLRNPGNRGCEAFGVPLGDVKASA